jgi:uroporphyrinogen decarboxylase
MAYGRPENVRNEAADALKQTQGKRFILGTGCVLPIIAPHSNIMAAIESVDQT